MRFIPLFFFLISQLSFGALTEVDFAEFEINDEIRSNITHKLTVSEVRDEDHLSELLRYYSQLLPNNKDIEVQTFSAFYSEESLKKNNVGENQAKEAIDRLWNLNFPKNSLEQFELGEGSLSEIFNERTPSSKNKFNAFRVEKIRTKTWFQKNFRVSLSLIRTFVGGTAAGWAFTVSGMPIIPAAVMGGIIGSMSGAIQYHIGTFADFLETNKFTGQARNWLVSKMPFLEKLGIRKAEKIGKKSNYARFMSKMLFLEFSFIGVIEVALSGLSSLDMIVYYQSFWDTFHNMTVSGFVSVASQGVWEAGIVKEFNPKIARVERLIELAKANGQLSRLANLESLHHKLLVKRAAMFVYGSATAVSALVLKTLGLKVSWALFGGLGASGLINNVRVNLKGKKNWFKKQISKIPGICKIYSH